MDQSLTLISDAQYSIELLGILDQSWVDQFGSFQVEFDHTDDPDRSPVTSIVGEVADQAALTGLLNLAYSLGLPLISVTYLGRS